MPKLSKTKKKAISGSAPAASPSPYAARGAAHPAPLGQSIEDDARRSRYVDPSRGRGLGDRDDDGGSSSEEEDIDAATTRRILETGQRQRDEMAREERRGVGAVVVADDDSSADEDEDYVEEEEGDYDETIVHDAGYVDVVSGPEMTEEEERIVRNMMEGGGEKKAKTLGEIIEEKIREKEENIAMRDGEGEGANEPHMGLPPKVVEVYTDIGRILSRYTAGKLPKAFKVIPSLSNWEEILYLTRPDTWSPQAMYAATRIFASNLNPKMAQRFYNLVLLDAVRADIVTNKKLNYHLYAALKKSLYKPAAFFRGILLPLCASGDCSLREAAIVSSVLQRESVPMHHAAVAIVKLAEMEYGGATSVFLRTLLDKKYSLPQPVVQALITQHYARFAKDRRTLPVLWHRCLLVFAQRYKNDLKDDRAREVLKEVVRVHYHPKITPEIRRELFGAEAWRKERNDDATEAGEEDASMEV